MVDEVLAGNRRALAKAISLVENDGKEKQVVLGRLFKHTGRAYTLGVTGSPGAGKSSLVDKLTEELRRWGLTVGIIAVDPTSPFTGGALLGDRIRMQSHVLDEGVFIRSMGTRGSLGGLSRATKEVIKVMDAAGRDMVLVETVGVGQSELDIMHAADTTIVVLTPGAGDVIQTMKAGIMEIADIFAVNKADMDGSDKLVSEVQNMLDMGPHKEWRPPVLPVISLNGQGIRELYAAIGDHRAYLEKSGQLEAKRRQRLKDEVGELIRDNLERAISRRLTASTSSAELLERLVAREIDPYSMARELMSNLNLEAS